MDTFAFPAELAERLRLPTPPRGLFLRGEVVGRAHVACAPRISCLALCSVPSPLPKHQVLPRATTWEALGG